MKVSAPPPPQMDELSPEEKAARDLAKREADESKIVTAQDRAQFETDRLFRLFGARAAFGGGGSVAPISGQ